jgi:hypothetical protein
MHEGLLYIIYKKIRLIIKLFIIVLSIFYISNYNKVNIYSTRIIMINKARFIIVPKEKKKLYSFN